VLRLSDPAVPIGKAFYRLSEAPASTAFLSSAARAQTPPEPKEPATYRAPRMVESCGACVR